MKRKSRDFSASLAVRTQVPILFGLFGASGSGKTFSALRLATGIQSVAGGEVYFVDTEADRALAYADHFKFHHVPFDAPFGSLDYLDVLRWCVTKGAKTIVVDSLSHEHSGEGGYLLTQEAEMERMAGDDWQKRERVKFAAWIKPAAQRSALINGFLQLRANFIFCFRAKEKTKPVKNAQGKMEPVEMGFTPIGGEEFVYEMSASALLLPRSDGIPTWKSEHIGERLAIKLPDQFNGMLDNGKPLSEEHGRMLAEWARGGMPAKRTESPSAGQSAPLATKQGSLADRATAVSRALRAAKTAADIEKVYRKAGSLLTELPEEDRNDLALLYEARHAELTESEAAAKAAEEQP